MNTNKLWNSFIQLLSNHIRNICEQERFSYYIPTPVKKIYHKKHSNVAISYPVKRTNNKHYCSNLFIRLKKFVKDLSIFLADVSFPNIKVMVVDSWLCIMFVLLIFTFIKVYYYILVFS